MGKIKTFWHTFSKSLTSINYYREIVEAPRAFSMKYFVTLALLVSIAMTSSIMISTAPKVKTSVTELLNQTVQAFPEDLIITSQDGKLSINRTEPFIVPSPKDMETNTPQAPNVKNLLVFDPAGTIDDLDKYQTVILINEANMIARSETGQVQTSPLKNFPNGEFARKDAVELAQKLQPMANALIAVIALVVFAATVIYNFVGKLVYLVIPAFVFWMVGKFRNVTAGAPALGTFGKNYQVAIHSMTLPVLAETAFLAFGFVVPIPLWFLALHVVLGLVVVYVLSTPTTAEGK